MKNQSLGLGFHVIRKMKVKSFVQAVFSPDVFKALFYLVSLLGVCPLLGEAVDPCLKLFHVYALLVVVFDLMGEKRILRNKGRIFVVIFGLCYVFTLITNKSLQNVSALSNFAYLLAELGLIFSYGKNSKKIDRISSSLLTTFISAANLVGIWMFFAKTHIYVENRGYIGMYTYENRLAGLFGNPNVLGMVCMGAICLSMILFVTSQRRNEKIYFGVLCGINVLTLMLSNSRTQIYSVIFMCAVLVLMLSLKSGITVKRVLTACGVSALAVVVVYFGVLLVQQGLSQLDLNYNYYLQYISAENGQRPETDQPKEGIIVEDGVMYYYENGEKTYGGLIKIGEDYYYVNSNCQVVTGSYYTSKTNDILPADTYEFGEDGKMLWSNFGKEDTVKQGIFTEDGVMRYYVDGKRTGAGLIKIGEDYYYINSYGEVVTGTYHVTKTNGLLPEGTYEFGEDGKLILPLNGIVEEDGVLYYYVDDEKTYAGLIKIGEDYYYVNSSGQVVTGNYRITKTNDLMPVDEYEFGSDGKMVLPRNGIVEEDGVLYYYVDDEKTYVGMIEIDDNLYYINSSCQVVTGYYHITKTNGLVPVATYHFSEEGKLIQSANGFTTIDGVRYYYEDGQKVYVGLMKLGEDYYYVNSYGQVVTGTYHVTKTNDLLPEDTYEFGQDGKMILPETNIGEDGAVKNGIVEEEGVKYYYVNGKKTYAGLIQIEDNFYYVNSSCQVVTGTYHVTKINDLMSVATYEFSEEGKLIQRANGFVTLDGVKYYYANGKPVYAGLIKVGKDYYYVNSSGKVVTGTYRITKTNDLLPADTYGFAEDGKLILPNPGTDNDGIKNGFVVENGVKYYYENYKKTYAGLIKIGEDYYYVNSSCQVVTGSYRVTKTNGLLPVNTYEFDQNGKLLGVASNNNECEAGSEGQGTINRKDSEGLNGRLELWVGSGLELFKAAPVFGVGLDNHDNALGELGLPALPVRGNLHNVYLDVLVCCGLAGFACLVAFLLSMCGDVVRFFRYNDGKTWTLGAVMLASVLAYMLDGMADSTLISSFYPTSVSFWYIASQFANLLEEENMRTGHYRKDLLCKWSDKVFDSKK